MDKYTTPTAKKLDRIERQLGEILARLDRIEHRIGMPMAHREEGTYVTDLKDISGPGSDTGC